MFAWLSLSHQFDEWLMSPSRERSLSPESFGWQLATSELSGSGMGSLLRTSEASCTNAHESTRGLPHSEEGRELTGSQWKLVLLEGFLGHMVERPRREWEEKPGPKCSDCVVS